jgi:aarF domain-containing kinase
MMREREVPSTPLARMWGFGSLATRMVLGAVADNAAQIFTGIPASSSGSRISDKNAERLAEALCRMRGAALKLGQILSLQDDGMLPPALSKALERVKQAADYMPKRQLEAQLVNQLGDNWRSHFKSFDEIPLAAASIGQVHRAVLLDGTDVALKIQYPGVADSIESDLSNLKRLVTMTNLLPPGLFIDQIIHVASTELAMECDYLLEAESQKKYREFILADVDLKQFADVPEIYSNLTTKRILTSRFVPGVAIDKAMTLSQETRNSIARTILIMTIRELFHLRFMQSDPNFGNFLYDEPSHRINLVDFGAARAYSKPFVDGYMHLVWAAANRDKDTILRVSREMGFLTGDES